MFEFVYGLLILFHWLISYASATLDYCSYVVNFEVGKCQFTSFILFLIVLAIWGPLSLNMNVRNSLSISAKKSVGILIGITLNM